MNDSLSHIYKPEVHKFCINAHFVWLSVAYPFLESLMGILANGRLTKVSSNEYVTVVLFRCISTGSGRHR